MNSLKKFTSVLLLCLMAPFPAVPQDNKNKQKNPTSQPIVQPAATPRPALEFGLSEDTPVRIKLTRTMSSKDAKMGEKVDFEVLEDVKVKDVVVIQHGSMAIATVTKAQPKRSMGRSGKLDINIDYVQLVDGEKVPLRATKGGSGGSHTGAMTGAMVATGILFFPAAPLFLFMKGKNITLPQGTEVSAYVAADTPLDPSKFNKVTSSTQSETVNSEAVASGTSAVKIASNPDGAEIMIDKKLMGTTPSTIQLSPGEHTIVLDKAGFKGWQRTITVTAGGTINLEANLEKTP